MCRVILSDRQTNAKLIGGGDMKAINNVLTKTGLRWFRHVEHKVCDGPDKKCSVMKVEGRGPGVRLGWK